MLKFNRGELEVVGRCLNGQQTFRTAGGNQRCLLDNPGDCSASASKAMTP
jgi:hypothetical protein